VLGDIAQKENLLLTDEDVEQEIALRATEQGTSPESMKAYIDANKQQDLVRNVAQTKKVLGFLSASAIITERPLSDTKPLKVSGDANKQAEKPKDDEVPTKPKARKKKTDEPASK
jgi:FKBP-type peptidyl-prolyl cis-trans isomerase (trigger factor)